MGVLSAMDSPVTTQRERLRSKLHLVCPFTTLQYGLNWDGEVEAMVSVPPNASQQEIDDVYTVVRSWVSANDVEGHWRVCGRDGVTVGESEGYEG